MFRLLLLDIKLLTYTYLFALYCIYFYITFFERLKKKKKKKLKYRSRSCITGNIALGAWSRANKALGCAPCFIGSRPRPRGIFLVMHSHGTNRFYAIDAFSRHERLLPLPR